MICHSVLFSLTILTLTILRFLTGFSVFPVSGEEDLFLLHGFYIGEIHDVGIVALAKAVGA